MLKPSQIYTRRNAQEEIKDLLKREGYRPIAFRCPEVDEKFVPSCYQGDPRPVWTFTPTMTIHESRIIVERV